MNRRSVAVVVAVAALASPLLAGCSSGKDEGGPAASPTGGARRAVADYLSALNARSTNGVIEIGGVKDEPWSRREASKILADKGGRGWKIRRLEIDFDMGPDTGSAHLSATDKAGRPMNETFTVIRDRGTWHLVVFTEQPAPPGRTPASTAVPTTAGRTEDLAPTGHLAPAARPDRPR